MPAARRSKNPQSWQIMQQDWWWARSARRPLIAPSYWQTFEVWKGMRILQVNSARHLGGAETHVIELTDALRRRGHNVVVAGRRNGPVQPQIHLPFLNSADVYSAYRLRRFLKTTPFDVVHAHVARD